MAGHKQRRERKTYSPEFKQQMVDLHRGGKRRKEKKR